jgi:hypothetical protein
MTPDNTEWKRELGKKTWYQFCQDGKGKLHKLIADEDKENWKICEKEDDEITSIPLSCATWSLEEVSKKWYIQGKDKKTRYYRYNSSEWDHANRKTFRWCKVPITDGSYKWAKLFRENMTRHSAMKVCGEKNKHEVTIKTNTTRNGVINKKVNKHYIVISGQKEYNYCSCNWPRCGKGCTYCNSWPHCKNWPCQICTPCIHWPTCIDAKDNVENDKKCSPENPTTVRSECTTCRGTKAAISCDKPVTNCDKPVTVRTESSCDKPVTVRTESNCDKPVTVRTESNCDKPVTVRTESNCDKPVTVRTEFTNRGDSKQDSMSTYRKPKRALSPKTRVKVRTPKVPATPCVHLSTRSGKDGDTSFCTLCPMLAELFKKDS